MAADPIYVFWDNSNIYIPAQGVSEQREQGVAFNRRALRLHFEHLVDLVRCGRKLAYGIAVGSVPPELRSVWDHLRKCGLAVELFERGSGSGTEQGCDQCLQVHMLRVLNDYDPAVAVLLTGDGGGYDDGVGFHSDLERMYKRGWGIEVVSWNIACATRLRQWAKDVGIYIPLEDYYENVTFVENGRTASPVLRRNHAIAAPRPVGV